MSYMFNNLNKIENLNIKSFKTKNLKDMSYMFRYCDSLKTIDLSNFDTTEVTNMLGMFYIQRKWKI